MSKPRTRSPGRPADDVGDGGGVTGAELDDTVVAPSRSWSRYCSSSMQTENP